MGRIARLLSFVRRTRRSGAEASEAKVDMGSKYLITAENFAPPGDDSRPLPGDYVLIVGLNRAGGGAAAAYADIDNPGEAAPGEKRLYARDPDTGNPVVSVWLKNDGAVVIGNGNGSITLGAAGEVDINGATIATDGTISAPVIEADTSLTVDGKEMLTHTHAQPADSDGDAEAETLAPT